MYVRYQKARYILDEVGVSRCGAVGSPVWASPISDPYGIVHHLLLYDWVSRKLIGRADSEQVRP